MNPALLGPVGAWLRATEKWEYHAASCGVCNARQPGQRCGEGARAYEAMYETFRAAQAADILAAERGE